MPAQPSIQCCIKLFNRSCRIIQIFYHYFTDIFQCQYLIWYITSRTKNCSKTKNGKSSWKLQLYHGDISEISRSSLCVRSSMLASLVSDIRDNEHTDTWRRRSKNWQMLERSVGDAATHNSSSPRQRVIVPVCHTEHQLSSLQFVGNVGTDHP